MAEPGACKVDENDVDLAALKAEIRGLIGTVGQLSTAITAMSVKLEKLAVLEERASAQKMDVDRSFSMMRRLEERIQQHDVKFALLDPLPGKVQAIEIEMPLLKRGNGWIDRVITVTITAVLMAVLFTVLPPH